MKYLLTILFMVGALGTGFSQAPVSHDRMQDLVMTKIQMDKEGKFKDRYKIQLYYGELDGANRILNKYRSIYSEWSSDLEYEAPNHKIWIGNFRTRLEADRALVQIQKNFPNAFVFQPGRG